jgi:hypothetical protein
MKSLMFALSLSLVAGAAFGQSTDRPNQHVPQGSRADSTQSRSTPPPSNNSSSSSSSSSRGHTDCGGSACVGSAK